MHRFRSVYIELGAKGHDRRLGESLTQFGEDCPIGRGVRPIVGRAHNLSAFDDGFVKFFESVGDGGLHFRRRVDDQAVSRRIGGDRGVRADLRQKRDGEVKTRFRQRIGDVRRFVGRRDEFVKPLGDEFQRVFASPDRDLIRRKTRIR